MNRCHQAVAATAGDGDEELLNERSAQQIALSHSTSVLPARILNSKEARRAQEPEHQIGALVFFSVALASSRGCAL